MTVCNICLLRWNFFRTNNVNELYRTWTSYMIIYFSHRTHFSFNTTHETGEAATLYKEMSWQPSLSVWKYNKMNVDWSFRFTTLCFPFSICSSHFVLLALIYPSPLFGAWNNAWGKKVEMEYSTENNLPWHIRLLLFCFHFPWWKNIHTAISLKLNGKQIKGVENGPFLKHLLSKGRGYLRV